MTGTADAGSPVRVIQRIFSQAATMVSVSGLDKADRAFAHVVLAIEHANVKRFLPGAREQCGRAFALQPNWHGLAMMLSGICAMMRNFALALDSMRDAIRLLERLGASCL